ncbi:MAG TPA: J domain-containing protein [Hyphomicrobiaceae bacterium]|nr:J domain-containing protein [Hyphomicrobiaceae bacterium]
MRGANEYVPERSPALVEIRLADGTVLKGKLMVSIGKGVGELLNGPGPFLAFESHTGERSFVCKSQVAVVRELELAKPAPLGRRLNGQDELEPHKILGVEPGAEQEEIRQAYLRMAKGYHPDRFASVDLPPEVREYLAAMVRRINTAYAALEHGSGAGSEAPASSTAPSR